MKVARTGCEVIGAMRPARGGAAFVRAPLVVRRREPEALFMARRIPAEGPFEGEPMDLDAWRGVLSSGEALALDAGQPLAPEAALWLLRPGFSFRQEARREIESRGALVHAEEIEGTSVLLVREALAAPLREPWGERAFNEAWQRAGQGRLREALEAAELAVDLARGLVEERLALASLLYDRTGDKARGEAYLEMARNSKGEEFYRRACEKKERFAREFDAHGGGSGPGVASTLPARKERQRMAIESAFAAMPGGKRAA
jgi:tetratricopeptide (TPR) repeat protein